MIAGSKWGGLARVVLLCPRKKNTAVCVIEDNRSSWHLFGNCKLLILATKVARLSTLHAGPLYPQKVLLILITVKGWVDLRVTVSPGGLRKWKNVMTPSGIEPSLFWLGSAVLQLAASPRTPAQRQLSNNWALSTPQRCVSGCKDATS